jgi:hypothetical protein
MQLTKRPLSHYLVHNESTGLLVIGDKVLDGCRNAMRLDRIDVGGSELATEEWVVTGEGFEVAAAEG